jgi:molybdopterin-containing oxidoreductase family membrane subunit
MLLLAIAGLISIGIRFYGGMKVTNLTSSVPWGMWVVFYIYFVGLSAGTFLIYTLPYVFGIKKLEDIGPLSLLLAILSLLTGLLFIWIDLGHPFRFYKVIINWNYTSLLAWEFLFYALYFLILIFSFWFLSRCDLAHQIEISKGLKQNLAKILCFGFRCPTTRGEYEQCHSFSLKVVKILGILGIPLVLLVRGGTGALFAVVIARPHWFGGLLPIIFLVSGLLSATAMLLFIYPLFYGRKEDEAHLQVIFFLRGLLILFLVIETLLVFSEIFVGLYSKIPERLELYHKVMFGPFPYIFWGGQVLLGIIIPTLFLSYKKTRKDPLYLSLAGLSTSCGVVSIILNLVIPAYVLPLLKGLDSAFIDKRLLYFYFPSLIEWLSSFGLISLVSLCFIFLDENLPLLPKLKHKFK